MSDDKHPKGKEKDLQDPVIGNDDDDVVFTAPPDAGKEGADGKKKPKDQAAEAAAAKVAAKKVSLAQLFRYADGLDKLFIFLGLLGAAARGVVMPAFSFVFGELVDALNANSNVAESVLEVGLYFIYMGVGSFFAAWMQTTFLRVSAARQTSRIRKAYFQSVMRHEIGWFDTEGSNEVYSRMATDTLSVESALGDKLGNGMQFFCTFLFGFGLGFYHGWQLTLVILGLTPLLAGAGAFMMVMMAQLTTQGQKAYAAAGAVALEYLTAIRTVTSFVAQEKAIRLYDAELAKAKATNIRKHFVQGFGFGLVMFVMFASYALALWFGATQVAEGPSGGWTGGKVLTVFFAVLMGAFAIGQMGPSLTALSTGQGAAYTLFATIERKSAIDYISDAGTPVTSLNGTISLKQVTFRYPSRPEVPVLQGIDLDIKSGQKAALVGASGCGKSSIIALLMRFYDAESGTVELDGTDIRTLQIPSLRKHVGLVSQEPVLFSGTIAENIAYGHSGDATQAEIEAAAKLADAHEFISGFPEKYETRCGTKGAQLSGGQKQRIAIARAIIGNPQVLFLDEATSALDTNSEKVVQAALDRVVENRTTVVIAHRLATIMDADVIFVLDAGKVVQKGKFEELVADSNGKFYELCRAQGMKIEDGKVVREVSNFEAAEPAAADDEEGEGNEEADPANADVDGEGEKKANGANSPRKKSLTNSDTEALSPRSKKKKKNAKAAAAKKAAAAEKKGKNGLKKTSDEDDTPDEPDGPEIKNPGTRVAKMHAPEWWIFILGILGALINAAINPIFAIVFSEIFAVFYPNPNIPTDFTPAFEPSQSFYDDVVNRVMVWVYGFLGIAGGAFLGSLLQFGFFGHASERLTERIRHVTFAKLVRNEIGWFDEKRHRVGVLTARLSTDASLIHSIFGAQLAVSVQNIASIAGGFGVAFYFSWKLTLVVIATTPLIAFGQVAEMIAMKGNEQELQEAMTNATASATEIVTNIRTVHSCGKEAKAQAEYANQLAEPERKTVKKAVGAGFWQGFGAMVMLSSYTLTFWYGGTLVDSGELSFGDMMKCLMAVMMTAMGVGQAAAMVPDMPKAKAAAQSVFGILDRPSLIDPSSTEGHVPTAQLQGRIEFRNVAFRYPTRPDAEVMSDFSIVVEPGQVLALVGESGSGKSTAIQLIERFYDPLQGSVLLDGRDIREYNVKWLRENIGLVSQEPTLFTETVKGNIKFGAPNATDDQVTAAATNANAISFIQKFPSGMDTFLGEGGAQLSGGQKQRLAIARAVLKDPRVLLLDEATSALDTKSERVVQDALDRIMKGRTTIVVAHRLTTIRNADIIAVIRKGKIVELGKHDELMAKKKFYYKLVKRQA